MKVQRSHSPLLVLAILGVLGVQGCGWMFAGGSSGGDNPTIVASIEMSPEFSAGDTLQLRVWNKSQNPILDPNPLFDTTIVLGSAGNTVVIDRGDNSIPDTGWNLEVILNSNLTLKPSENFTENNAKDKYLTILPAYSGEAIAISPAEVQPGSSSILSSSKELTSSSSVVVWGSSSTRGSSSSVTPPISCNTDCMPDSTITRVFSRGISVPMPTEWLQPALSGEASYLVVLGTSVILSLSEVNATDSIAFGLSVGFYQVILTDSLGNMLSSWPIEIR